MRAAPAPAAARSEPGWRLLVAAGWALALAALLPGALAPGGGAPGALALGAALAGWAATVAVVRSDLATFTIPDGATLLIAASGLLAAAGAPWLAGAGAEASLGAARDALATGAGAFALFSLLAAAFRWRGREALGHGDTKLAGACALGLAPGDAALALEVAALLAIAALLLGRRGGGLRDAAVPFGAFLAPVAWLVALAAPPLRDAGWWPW